MREVAIRVFTAAMVLILVILVTGILTAYYLVEGKAGTSPAPQTTGTITIEGGR